MIELADPNVLRVPGTIFPMIVVVCTTCFFTRHFAWQPMSSGAAEQAGKMALVGANPWAPGGRSRE